MLQFTPRFYIIDNDVHYFFSINPEQILMQPVVIRNLPIADIPKTDVMTEDKRARFYNPSNIDKERRQSFILNVHNSMLLLREDGILDNDAPVKLMLKKQIAQLSQIGIDIHMLAHQDEVLLILVEYHDMYSYPVQMVNPGRIRRKKRLIAWLKKHRPRDLEVMSQIGHYPYLIASTKLLRRTLNRVSFNHRIATHPQASDVGIGVVKQAITDFRRISKPDHELSLFETEGPPLFSYNGINYNLPPKSVVGISHPKPDEFLGSLTQQRILKLGGVVPEGYVVLDKSKLPFNFVELLIEMGYDDYFPLLQTIEDRYRLPNFANDFHTIFENLVDGLSDEERPNLTAKRIYEMFKSRPISQFEFGITPYQKVKIQSFFDYFPYIETLDRQAEFEFPDKLYIDLTSISHDVVFLHLFLLSAMYHGETYDVIMVDDSQLGTDMAKHYFQSQVRDMISENILLIGVDFPGRKSFEHLPKLIYEPNDRIKEHLKRFIKEEWVHFPAYFLSSANLVYPINSSKKRMILEMDEPVYVEPLEDMVDEDFDEYDDVVSKYEDEQEEEIPAKKHMAEKEPAKVHNDFMDEIEDKVIEEEAGIHSTHKPEPTVFPTKPDDEEEVIHEEEYVDEITSPETAKEPFAVAKEVKNQEYKVTVTQPKPVEKPQKEDKVTFPPIVDQFYTQFSIPDAIETPPKNIDLLTLFEDGIAVYDALLFLFHRPLQRVNMSELEITENTLEFLVKRQLVIKEVTKTTEIKITPKGKDKVQTLLTDLRKEGDFIEYLKEWDTIIEFSRQYGTKTYTAVLLTWPHIIGSAYYDQFRTIPAEVASMLNVMAVVKDKTVEGPEVFAAQFYARFGPNLTRYYQEILEDKSKVKERYIDTQKKEIPKPPVVKVNEPEVINEELDLEPEYVPDSEAIIKPKQFKHDTKSRQLDKDFKKETGQEFVERQKKKEKKPKKPQERYKPTTYNPDPFQEDELTEIKEEFIESFEVDDSTHDMGEWIKDDLSYPSIMAPVCDFDKKKVLDQPFEHLKLSTRVRNALLKELEISTIGEFATMKLSTKIKGIGPKSMIEIEKMQRYLASIEELEHNEIVPILTRDGLTIFVMEGAELPQDMLPTSIYFRDAHLQDFMIDEVSKAKTPMEIMEKTLDALSNFLRVDGESVNDKLKVLLEFQDDKYGLRYDEAMETQLIFDPSYMRKYELEFYEDPSILQEAKDQMMLEIRQLLFNSVVFENKNKI